MTTIELNNNLQVANHLTQDSFTHIDGLTRMIFNGFNRHIGIELDPKSVWTSIVYQVYLLVTKNAEILKDKFITSTDGDVGGKKTLDVMWDGENILDTISQFKELIYKNIKDHRLIDWMFTKFSTSNQQDELVMSLMLMGTMKEYFNYTVSECGLPKIVIAGDINDWILMIRKLKYIEEFVPLLPQYNIRKWINDLNELIINCVLVNWGHVDLYYWNNFCVNCNLKGSGSEYVKGHCIVFNRFYLMYGKLHENDSSLLSTICISSEYSTCTINKSNGNAIKFEAGNTHCTYDSEKNVLRMTPNYRQFEMKLQKTVQN